MAERDVFDDFAAQLESHLGTPDGRTDDDVKNTLENIYNDTISALERYSQILSHQGSDITLAYGFRSINKRSQRGTYKIELTMKGHTIDFSVVLAREDITAQNGYLATLGEDGHGSWRSDQQSEFIKDLGRAFLKAFGA